MKKFVVGVGIDRDNKVIEIFDKFNIAHTEAYLEIIKTTMKMIPSEEFKDYSIKLEDKTFKNVEDFAEENLKQIEIKNNKLDSEIKEIEKLNPDLENRFTYHKPTGNKPDKFVEIREMAKELAYTIEALCPECRERSLALTKLEETVMWVNAGIARNKE